MIDPDGSAACGVSSPHTWITVYDDNDRVTENRDPLVRSAFTGYDGAGNRTSATDRNGNITTYTYDGAARLLNVKQKPDPVGGLVYRTTVTVRDGNGNATQVTQDQQGSGGTNTVITDYAYDEINRLSSTTTHPSVDIPNLITSYKFDHNGNVLERTAGDGVKTTYTYDALSRLSTVAAPGLSTITYKYNEVSSRKEMTDGTGTSTYTYDGLGRLKTANQPNGNLVYDYDLDSNRFLLTYPTVGSVTYGFSNAGRLLTLTDWASRLSTYTYYPSGLAYTVTLPGSLGGLTTTYTYDNAHRLATLVNATGAGTVTSHTYTLDNEGNRTAVDEIIANGPSVKVNSDTGTVVQDHPAIAVGADGASYLIWDDARLGNADIEFAKRDPATGVWGANVKVNDDTGTRIQQNPAIALDSTNNAYAVWQDERNGAGKADIFFSRRTAAGVWSPTNLKVSDDPGGGGGAVQRNRVSRARLRAQRLPSGSICAPARPTSTRPRSPPPGPPGEQTRRSPPTTPPRSRTTPT